MTPWNLPWRPAPDRPRPAPDRPRPGATAPDAAQALTRYAAALHAHVDDDHHVVSPLGAWMLAALPGPAATATHRDALAAALGMPVDHAAALVRSLLAAPHPAVHAALALWTCDAARSPELIAWEGTLPAGTSTGPVPDQARADAWTREHTLGIIDSFPLTLTPDLLFVLATALATKVSWAEPFAVVDGARLTGPATDAAGPGPAPGPWAGAVRRALLAPGAHGVAVARVDGDLYGVHTADSTDGLTVVSVVGDPAAPRARVLAAAHQVAVAAARHDGSLHAHAVDPFDLPLGHGHAWHLAEQVERTFGPGPGRSVRTTALLPAWQAATMVGLDAPALGVPAAAGVVDALVPPTAPRGPLGAVQVARARYGARGFEAAAVSVMARAGCAPVPTETLVRTLDLRFAHPYAVVAVARDPRGGPGRPAASAGVPALAAPGAPTAADAADAPSPWHGLPVFSAWVADPEAEPDDA